MCALPQATSAGRASRADHPDTLLTHERIRVEGSDADEAAGEPRMVVVGEHAEELIEKSQVESSTIDVYRDNLMIHCHNFFMRHDRCHAYYANIILVIECIDQPERLRNLKKY